MRLRESREESEQADSVARVTAIRDHLRSTALLRDDSSRVKQERKREQFGGRRIRALNTPEGWEILIGENSEANDYLTGRVAAPNDLWLHVRAATSAHVVIRTRNDPAAVPKSVIRRAALLAAQHSGVKHSSVVPVDYTLKKYVRRPRGAPSGTVTYQQEKTIHVSPRDATA